MNRLRQLARENHVKLPQHVTKLELARILESEGIDISHTEEPPPRTQRQPKSPAKKSSSTKQSSSSSEPGTWRFIAQGRDGTVHMKGQYVRKTFASAKKAALEDKYTRIMSGSGVAPEIVSYDGDRTLIMTKVSGVDLTTYMSQLGNKEAPAKVQQSFIHALQQLDAYQVNPNDNNPANWMVDASSGKVWRIDFGAAKVDKTHNALTNFYVLASKIYKRFPSVIKWIEPYMWVPPVWKSKFGYQ
jgi:predicted Ser/Thr protein kinase